MTIKNFLEKYLVDEEDENILEIEYSKDDDQLICPHCNQVVKKKEFKIGKNGKYLIHGKCNGKVSINDDTVYKLSEDLFENKSDFIKGKITKIISKAVEDLDISKLGKITQNKQSKKFKSNNPLKQAKKGSHKKVYKPKN